MYAFAIRGFGYLNLLKFGHSAQQRANACAPRGFAPAVLGLAFIRQARHMACGHVACPRHVVRN